MKLSRQIGQTRALPAVSAILLATLACGSDPLETGDVNPFTAETYDELILAPQKAEAAEPRPHPAPAPGELGVGSLALDAGVAEGGSGPAGTGGAGPIGNAGTSNTGASTGTGGIGGGFTGSGGGFSVGGSFGTAGSASGGSTGKGDGGVPPSGQPSALWRFDDCSAVTRALLDSSGNGIHAIRTVSSQCAEGLSGQAVAFDEAGDRVEALNAPQFALDRQLAVAAWVHPNRTDGNRPVVLKRLRNQTAFSLRVQNGQAQFSVELESRRRVTARAPIASGAWSHVAGLFDGGFVFLFINGEQVAKLPAQGSIRDVDVVLRIGGTTQTQRFDGRIDEVFISTSPLSADELATLSCARRPSTLEVSPPSSGPHEPGTQAAYSVSAVNNDTRTCGPRGYFLDPFFILDFELFADPSFVFPVAPGDRAEFTLFATSDEEAEPGPVSLPFFVSSFGGEFDSQIGEVEYIVGEPSGCFSRTSRELFIRNVSVVDDPLRTSFDGPPGDPRTGAWTFGRLMEWAAPAPEDAPDMVEQMFSTLTAEQSVNSFSISPRFQASELLLDPWPRGPDGRLDLGRAPLRLLAIVNRIDLRDLDAGHAGEGRFVFGVLGPFGEPLEFTVILEYRLAATTEADVLDWAQAWHALSQHPFPSEEYNAALQAITDAFAGRGVAPGRPNGSGLLRVRTNEIALDFPWQLREFTFGDDGFLEPATVKLTPDARFNGTAALGRFINQNEAAILAERHDVPLEFEGSPFLAGTIFNNIDLWFAPGVVNNEARHKLSLNTCNGCHGAETNTFFLHVNPRFAGQESFLSSFLSGTTVFDPVSGEVRRLDDLARRRADLQTLVCPAPVGLRAQTAPTSGTSVRKGIGRVH